MKKCDLCYKPDKIHYRVKSIIHKDWIFCCDDCKLIKNIGNWEIELTTDNNSIEENNYPDWYGYQKIDGI